MVAALSKDPSSEQQTGNLKEMKTTFTKKVSPGVQPDGRIQPEATRQDKIRQKVAAEPRAELGNSLGR